MIPIQVATNHKQRVELSKIPLLGYFGLFGISLLPAVGSMALAAVVSAVLDRAFTRTTVWRWGCCWRLSM